MIDETLKKLIEYIMQVAPAIWQAAYRQVYLYIYIDLIWFIFILIGTISGYFLLRKGLKAKKEYKYNDSSNDGEIEVAFGWATIIISIIINIFVVTEMFSYLYNPYWYAIREVINLAK